MREKIECMREMRLKVDVDVAGEKVVVKVIRFLA